MGLDLKDAIAKVSQATTEEKKHDSTMESEQTKTVEKHTHTLIYGLRLQCFHTYLRIVCAHAFHTQWKEKDWETICDNIENGKISESIELLETRFKDFPINHSFNVCYNSHMFDGINA